MTFDVQLGDAEPQNFLLSWHKTGLWFISYLLFRKHNLAIKAQAWVPGGNHLSRTGTCASHLPIGNKRV